jgi:predicted GNAT superfamily acetyltransferase
MHVELVLPAVATWNAEIDRIGALLDVQNNPAVFPYHFLQVVLPSLGGAMVEVTEDSRYLIAGFLFPRDMDGDVRAAGPTHAAGSGREYTFRYHPLADNTDEPALIAEVAEILRTRLAAAAVVPYSPHGAHTFTRTEHAAGSAVIGHPDEAEAAQIRRIHRQIWNSPREYLYPTDIHSDEFRLGTSLVARVDGQVAGFLFGFYRFNGPALPSAWAGRFRSALRLESQTMGVLPQFRGMRLGNLLKRTQADEALAKGINMIHWTADPLQYPNAALNFGLLRAVAYDFQPDYYPFRNDLNRVPASRFALTWLIDTERVRNVPAIGSSALILDLHHQPRFFRVNDGYDRIRLDVEEPFIAIQIPPNWTEMQQTAGKEALRWREATDQIFQRYIGIEERKYVITGVAVQDDNRYLVGQRADETLWRRLAL